MADPNEFAGRIFRSFLTTVERNLLIQEFIDASAPDQRGLAVQFPDGTVTFRPDGPNPVTTAAQLLGAAFRDPEGAWTWRWGWENPYGFEDRVLTFAKEVYELGSGQEDAHRQLLCDPSTPLPEGPGPAVWNGYIASSLLAHHDLAPLFFNEEDQLIVLVVKFWDAAPPATASRVVQALRTAQEVFGLPWQTALASYAEQRGLRLDVRGELDSPDDPSQITMRYTLSGAEGGPVHAVLDTAGRLVAIESEAGTVAFEHDEAPPTPVFLSTEEEKPTPDSWSKLFDEALLAGVEKRLALGDFITGFQYFLSEGHVLLNHESANPINAPAQLLGVALLKEDGAWVWQWGWENPFHFPDEVLTISRQLRSIAERDGVEPLLQPSIPLPNGPGAAEGYGMLAAHLIPGLSPLLIEQDDQVAVAMTHFEVRARTTAGRIVDTMVAATRSAEPADWPHALRSYAQQRGFELFATPEGFVFHGAEGGPVTVVLDQNAQITAVESTAGRVELREPSAPVAPTGPEPEALPPTYPFSQELYTDVALWSWEQQLRLDDILGGDSPYGGPFQTNVQTGSITFNHGRAPSLTATAHVLGSAAPAEGTWLWGWANPNGFPAHVVAASGQVRDYLVGHGHDRLAAPTLPLWGDAREIARRIGAVASHVTGLPCFTFDAGGEMIVALLVEHPMFALREATTFRIDQVVVRATSVGMIADWPRALAAYAEKRGLGLERNEAGYTLLPPKGGAVSVELDAQGRVGLIQSHLDRNSF